MEVTSDDKLSEGLGLEASAPAAATEKLPAPRTPTRPPSGWDQAPGSASAAAGEGQPSAKRTRVVEYPDSQGRVHSFDPNAPNPEVPCPTCFELTSILSFTCNSCGYQLFKPASSETAREKKMAQGFIQQVRDSNRSNRSALGALKQVMKSHKKFAKKKNPFTGQAYTSIQDRFENDAIYRYRMMSSGWTVEMLNPLQKLLTEDILGDKPSYRTRDQIQAATSSYTSHPELGEGQPSAGNPDWNRTKNFRGQLREGLDEARSGQPVAPQIAGVLQHFGMDVLVREEEGDGEGQPSADQGEGFGSGQGTWWSSTWQSDAASSSGAAAPAWSSEPRWSASTAAATKKQYYPKPPNTWYDKKW